MAATTAGALALQLDDLSQAAKRWVESRQHQDAERLVELLRPVAYRFIVTITGRPAKPLVETAVARAVMMAPQWKERSQFSTWFFTICRRTAQRAAQERQFEELPELTTGDQDAFWTTLWREVREKLGDEERELLDARLEGRPVQKAAWRKLVRRIRRLFC